MVCPVHLADALGVVVVQLLGEVSGSTPAGDAGRRDRYLHSVSEMQASVHLQLSDRLACFACLLGGWPWLYGASRLTHLERPKGRTMLVMLLDSRLGHR